MNVIKGFVTIVLCCGFVQPTPEVRQYIERQEWDALKSLILSRAKSERQLDRNLEHLAKFRRDRLTCDEQLKSRTMPLKCFDVLEEEIRLGLLQKQKGQAMRETLDQICLSEANGIQSLGDLRLKALSKSTLSPKCRNQIAKRMEILKYKAMDTDRSALFDLRWQ